MSMYQIEADKEEFVFMAKYLIIVNRGPEDANNAVVPFFTGKALVEKGQEVTFWLYNQAAYLAVEGCAENILAPALPSLEEILLFLTMTHKCPIYIGISCAYGRGLLDEDHKPTVPFAYGEFVTIEKLAELIIEADHIINF